MKCSGKISNKHKQTAINLKHIEHTEKHFHEKQLSVFHWVSLRPDKTHSKFMNLSFCSCILAEEWKTLENYQIFS